MPRRMPRTVVRVLGTMEGECICILDHPPLVNGGVGHKLACDPNQAPFSDLQQSPLAAGAVLAAGQALLNDLKQQTAIAQALGAAFQNPGQLCPIYIYLHDAPRAELLPWECLYDPDPDLLFLSLRPDWPVIRMRQAQQQDGLTDYTLQPPLRVMAVLSATGDSIASAVSAQQEWNALWQAFTMNRPPHAMPVNLRVLVGEDALKTAIDQQAPQPGVEVQCDFISDRDQALTAIRDFAPHLLHFFCHGTTAGIPHLQLGTRADWTAQTAGSITITGSDLRDSADPHYQVWIVTLNCCESATQSRNARNLASSLVTVGFPAALGMRDVVEAKHAHLLTKRFYRALFEQFNAILVDAPPAMMEWGTALFEARQDLSTHAFNAPPVPPSQIAACDFKEWTLPALYMRTEPFLLKRIIPPLTTAQKIELLQQAETLQSQIVMVQGMNAPDDMKQDVIKDLQAKIAKIKVQLNA